MSSIPSSFVIPTFSEPRTRQEFDNLIVKLNDFYSKQGFTSHEASGLAGLTINLRQQGLKDADIQKQILQHVNTLRAKDAAKQAEIARLQAEQKPLLDKLAAEAAERAKKAAQQQEAARVKTAAELRALEAASKAEPMVANPDDPRGALIPLSQYNAILSKKAAEGKFTLNTTGNPETDRIRAEIAAQKNKTLVPVVIDVNKSFVLLSDGSLVDRASFKGTIPAELLAKANAQESQFPTSFNSQTDPNFQVKPKISANTTTDPTKNNVSATQKQDPVKSGRNTVFKPADPLKHEETLGGAIDAAAKAIEEALGMKKPEETTPPKQGIPFDPLKAINDALAGAAKTLTDIVGGATKTVTDLAAGAAKTVSDAAAAATQPPKQEIPKSEPTTASNNEKFPVTQPPKTTEPEFPAHGDPPDELTTTQKIFAFAKKNAVAITVGFAAVTFLAGMAMTLPNARKAVLEK